MIPFNLDSTAVPLNICRFCGAYHPNQVCPRIRSIEYNPDGTIKKIEFIDIDYIIGGWKFGD